MDGHYLRAERKFIFLSGQLFDKIIGFLSKKYPKCIFLKTKRGAKTPDFLVEYGNERIVIEIGGKGKGREQFKGIKVEKKFILSLVSEGGSDKKPLSLLGVIK